MRNKKLFVSIFIVCAMFFFACERYEGTISGNVVFMENGMEYPAIDAVITKIELKGATEIVIAKEKTDSTGNYVLSHIAKGSWKITGRLEIDSLIYEGASDVIVIDGANKEKQNLVLQPITTN